MMRIAIIISMAMRAVGFSRKEERKTPLLELRFIHSKKWNGIKTKSSGKNS
jgi:hypothetical protein